MPHTRTSDPPPVRIEADEARVWCGESRLDLPPKTFAVLRHLVEHAGRLVTKRDLLDAVWSGSVVSEASLTSCIRDLRRALADSSRAPRYIATVHRRGFRFIGPVATSRDVLASTASSPAPSSPRGSATPEDALVGRARELAMLDGALASARAGRRQLVLVSGEAGIGKSALVETFLARLDAPELRVLTGQCVEQYGTGEAYLPLLDALGRSAGARDGADVVRVLRRVAPTWLAQLPLLLDDGELDALSGRTHGTTRERMLRELGDALEQLAAERPLVLVLEDLHWSDSATIDLLSMVARRSTPARLLILGTVRPADVKQLGHPLASVEQELLAHGLCTELALAFLDEDAVATYLARRFPSATLPAELARLLREASGGNPLFLVNLVDDLVGQHRLRPHGDGRWSLDASLAQIGAAVPATLSQVLDKQIARLSDEERAVLAVCSVAGGEFSAALSLADGIDARTGERCCDVLARRGQFLRASGVAEWPDGTVAARFSFIHAAYRNALYERVPIGHRVDLHRRIGALLERAYGARAAEIAGELAMHFTRGRDVARAARHHQVAAEAALGRHAYREAVRHAEESLAMAASLPPSARSREHELTLETLRGAALVATEGWGAPHVAEAYGRARELCAGMGATPRLFPVLLGLSGFYLMRGELGTAADVTRRLLEVADATGDAEVLLGASNTAGLGAFYGGDFAAAHAHFARASAAARARASRRTFVADHDPATSCAAHTAWTLWVLGQEDAAVRCMDACLEEARALDHPVTLVMALNFAASFFLDRGDLPRVARLEDERSVLATEHGLLLFLHLGEIHRGWLDCAAGRAHDGIARMRRGLDVCRLAGAVLGTPNALALLAAACGRAGRLEEGLAALDEASAVAARTGLHYWDAELRRVRGDLLLATGGARARAATTCFREARDIAERQGAVLFARRASESLARVTPARTGAARGSRARVR